MSNTLDITADAMITAAATALNAAVEKVCAFSHYPLSHIVWSQIASLRYFAGEGVAHAQIISEIIKDKLAEAAVAQGIACRTAAADSIKDCFKKTLDCLKKYDFWDNWHIVKDSLTARIKDCPESLTHFINVACATLTDAGLVLAAPTPGDFEELLPALPSRTASRTPEQPTHPVTPLAPIALEGAGASLVDAPVTESLESAKRNAKRNLLTNFEAAQAQGQGTDLEEDDLEIVVHIMPPYVPPAVQEEVAAAPAPVSADAPVEAPKKKRKAHSQGKVEPRPKRQRQCKFPKNLDDYC